MTDSAYRVLRVYSGGVDVDRDGEHVRATIRGRLLAGRRRAKHILAPGDMVLLSAPERGGDQPSVDEILPRRNCISRTAAGGRYRQVLYANVDLLVVVGSVAEPELRPGLFDRFLVAAEREGIDALLVANKCDLPVPRQTERTAQVYRNAGYQVIFTSVESGEGLEELGAAIETAGLVVFAGHSGVGKSSLLNRMFPGFQQPVKTVSAKHGRGRHTTTQTLLVETAPGHYIADTPGVRSFALYDTLPDEVAFGFREFIPLIASCRFRGCTHVHEPSCAILAAVESGKVAPMRYQSYVRIIGAVTSGEEESEE